MNSGKIRCKKCNGWGRSNSLEICDKCNGKGRYPTHLCDNCNNTGCFLIRPTKCIDCDGKGVIDDVEICEL